MGASSRSPSPMTMVPRMFIWLNALRMASTAAWSASFSSPRPITRADAIAAASVSRTASRPMFLSIADPLRGPAGRAELFQQPIRRAGRLQLRTHADVDGMPEREDRVIGLPVNPVVESNLHPRVLVREVHQEHVVVERGLEVPDRRLQDGQQDAAPLDLGVRQPQVADEMRSRSLEETQVVRV